MAEPDSGSVVGTSVFGVSDRHVVLIIVTAFTPIKRFRAKLVSALSL